MPGKKGSKSGSTIPMSGDGKKPKAVSRTEKAGLQFSVSKVHSHMLQKKMGKVKRVSAGAPVWVAAAVEYFAAELIELAGARTESEKDKEGNPKRKRISASDVVQALRSDAELHGAVSDLSILVGDKLKNKKITDALITNEEQKEKELKKAEAAATKEGAAKKGKGKGK